MSHTTWGHGLDLTKAFVLSPGKGKTALGKLSWDFVAGGEGVDCPLGSITVEGGCLSDKS